jgi:hypothetical protein
LYQAYWDGTAIDHSLQGNDGVVNGAVFVENGLSFNGTSDYSTTPYDASLGILDNFTTFCWVKIAADETVGAIIAQFKNEVANRKWLISFGTDSWPNKFVFNTEGVSGLYRQAFTTTNKAVDTWWMVGATFEAGAMKIFIDGVSDNTGTQPDSTLANLANPIDAGVIRNSSNSPEVIFCKMILGEHLIFNTIKDDTYISNYFDSTRSRYK